MLHRAPVQERVEKIAALAKEGLNRKEIAIKLGVRPGYISQLCSRNDIHLTRASHGICDLDRNADILAARKTGRTLKQIGEEFDISTERVRQILSEMGMSDKPRIVKKWTPEKIAVAQEMRRCGFTLNEIGKAVGCHQESVSLHVRGIKDEFGNIMVRRRNIQIVADVEKGAAWSEIAEERGVCIETIARAMRAFRGVRLKPGQTHSKLTRKNK